MDSARIRTRIHLYANDQVPLQIEVYGIRHIGIFTPSTKFNDEIQGLRNELKLADPDFGIPAGVDMIIGANVYSQLLQPGLQQRGSLLAQKTVLGWIITGVFRRIDHPVANSLATTLMTEEDLCHEKLVGLLQRFWAVEEIPRVHRQSKDDLECETQFVNEHHRVSTGRYTVPLPKKSNTTALGTSLNIARLALSAQHRRMQRDPQLKQEYTHFMDEYVETGHMRRLTQKEIEDHTQPVNYIPHHGIWQRGDRGMKIRVVFNASRPTSSGKSLNDILFAGPKLQTDLPAVITRWRRHWFVYCADIKMMFRQILINRRDTHLQRIIWSPEENSPEEHFLLLTVTYGTTCAPYLAIRTLKQLCIDEGGPFPEAVKAIEEELYVDDFLIGADNLVDARRRRNELVQLLKKGGFELKKWVSNQPDLIEDVPAEDRLRPSWLHLSTGGLVNELGMSWDPVADQFKFTPPEFTENEVLSKRKVLAEHARLFDPMGWLAPLIVIGKMLIQDLWRAKLSWDEKLPTSMTMRWTKFRTNVAKITTLSLPRWINHQSSQRIELHAFADASRRAIAAAVYSRTRKSDKQNVVHLLAAKSKLTPIKSLMPSVRTTARMTIPRLELRAALLGAQLLRAQSTTLGIELKDCLAWSDSQVVIHWLHSDEPTGNDFVDNCISHIQETAPGLKWRYVPTDQNPADLATRGIDTENLRNNELWWHGPAWLSSENDSWREETQNEPQPTTSVPHEDRETLCLTTQVTSSIIERSSSLSSLLRSLVHCRRLLRWHGKVDGAVPPLVPISSVELEKEFLTCVRIAQTQDFAPEILMLKKDKNVKLKTTIARLKPYLDEKDILRVGGRLGNSQLSNEEKHPVILDGHSHFAKLIIDWAHTRALHGGPTLTHAYAVKRAWIIGGLAKTKSFVRHCVICARTPPRPSTQLMADLPSARVTPARPFSKTGVDYAGPFQIRRSKGRGITSSKGYVAVFVCLATKAIHLELVGDLTTDSFLGALARFASRRGTPLELWSDNATNFRGADLELRRLLRDAEIDWQKVESSLAEGKTAWHFIPPFAPHFGGLWEAGVKSMKIHLRRIAGTRSFTYEEFSTLLAEIEMALNSRPLIPFTGDVDDLDVLTPGHFIIGTSFASLPQPSTAEENLDRLTHWRLVRAARDQFWRRWCLDYLNTLQQRGKWTRPRQNLQVGDLVVVVDPTLIRPQGKWPLGRIVQVHSGKDNLTRVATVKLQNGVYTRPVTKLARLPVTTGIETSETD